MNARLMFKIVLIFSRNPFLSLTTAQLSSENIQIPMKNSRALISIHGQSRISLKAVHSRFMINRMSLRNGMISRLTSIFFDWNCGLDVRKSPDWPSLKIGKVSLLSLAHRLKSSSISFCIGCIWHTLIRFHSPSWWTVSMPLSIAKRRKRSCAVSRKRRTAAFRSQPSRKIAELSNLSLLNCWESLRRWEWASLATNIEGLTTMFSPR